MPDPTASRGQLLNFATDVAWRIRAYDAYGQKEPTDIRAIHKTFPEFTARQYKSAFTKDVELYDAPNRLVTERSADFWDEHKFSNEQWSHLHNEDLRKLFPEIRVSTICGLVGITFCDWHMR